MENPTQKFHLNEELVYWFVPEYDKHERSKRWYIGTVIALVVFLAYSLKESNFLFAVIIILAAIVIILNDGREPDDVKVSITDEGVIIGNKYYDYDEIKDFSIIYKPKFQIKNLYFEMKNPFLPRISIPLKKMNPLIIRGILLKYVTEDLERVDAPLSERLAKLFKL